MPGGWIDPLHFIFVLVVDPGLDEHRLTQDFQFKRNTQTSYLAGGLFFFRGKYKYISWNIFQCLSNQKTPKFCLLVTDLPLVRWGKDVKNQHSENVETLDWDGVGGARTYLWLPSSYACFWITKQNNWKYGSWVLYWCCMHVSAC